MPSQPSGFSDGPSMLTGYGASHSVFLKYRLRGLAHMQTSQRKFTSPLPEYSNHEVLFELRILTLGDATLLNQRLFNRLLQHTYTLFHISSIIARFHFLLRQLVADV